MLNTDTNNIGPRLGIAWAPVGSSYVVRAGYGLFYGRTPSIMVGTAHSNNGINVQTITFSGAAGNPVPTYPNRFASIPAGVTLPQADDLCLRSRLPERAHAAGEHRDRMGVDAEHVAGRQLSVRQRRRPAALDRHQHRCGQPGDVHRRRDVREALPHYQFAPGPFTSFTRVISFQSTAESRYNGVTVELNRRFAQGYQYRVAYTLGKVEDTVPDATAVVPEGADDRKFASNPGGLRRRSHRRGTTTSGTASSAA